MAERIPWIVWMVAVELHRRRTTCAVTEVPNIFDIMEAERLVKETLHG